MTTPQPTSLADKITTFIASRRFFMVIVAFFVFEAAWIACSGRYPMAFDENFHLGLIRLYAHHLSPFWSGQPAHAETFGAVARDPSYLYHYLMSFPYRLVSLFTSSETVHVMVLRFMNIGLFTYSLVLYRKLMLKSRASSALANACIAVFVLIPIAPLLAAQINYDNLILPLTAATLLLAMDISDEMRRTKRFNVRQTLSLIILCLLACLVKYAFLAITAAVAVFLVISVKRTYHSRRKLALSIGFGLTLMTRRVRWVLISMGIVAFVLFFERYGLNTIRYHKPIPDCQAVIGAQACESYSPWARDLYLQEHKPQDASSSPLVFGADWFYGMWLRTFFAVDGPATNFQTRGPLIVPAFSAIAFISIGFAAFLIQSKRLLKKYNPHLVWLSILVMMFYIGALWLEGYQSFLQTGQAVAINGRYLLLIMPLFILLCGLGLNEILREKRAAKVGLAGAAVFCMLWGGGALTYILRSNDAWYWRNQAVYDANHAVQHILGPITPGYYSPTEFMERN